MSVTQSLKLTTRCLTYIDDFVAHETKLKVTVIALNEGFINIVEKQWKERKAEICFISMTSGIILNDLCCCCWECWVSRKNLCQCTIPNWPVSRCLCYKKNTDSYQTHQDTHTSFWTCTLWMAYMLQLSISEQVSVWCYRWKAKPTTMLSEKLSGSITMSAYVAS